MGCCFDCFSKSKGAVGEIIPSSSVSAFSFFRLRNPDSAPVCCIVNLSRRWSLLVSEICNCSIDNEHTKIHGKKTSYADTNLSQNKNYITSDVTNSSNATC